MIVRGNNYLVCFDAAWIIFCECMMSRRRDILLQCESWIHILSSKWGLDNLLVLTFRLKLLAISKRMIVFIPGYTGKEIVRIDNWFSSITFDADVFCTI